jgi:hypothetical protein
MLRREVAAARLLVVAAHEQLVARLLIDGFGQRPSEPIDYLQVAPTTFVELDVGTSFQQDRWRHATRYVWLRAGLHPADVPVLDPPA